MVAILVILTILAFIAADVLIQWAQARRKQAQALSLPQTPIRPFTFEGISVPGGIFVDPGHTWVGVRTNGRAHVGLDDFAQKAIGRIDEVELPKVGMEIRQGEKLFSIRQGNRTIEFNAPIDGVVASVNQRLTRDPDAIKTDPYEQGWVCGLSPKNLAVNLKRLSIAEEALAWLNKEVQKFQAFISARPLEHMALGHVLQDGGQPADGVLEFMDDETWRAFTAEFIRKA